MEFNPVLLRSRPRNVRLFCTRLTESDLAVLLGVLLLPRQVWLSAGALIILLAHTAVKGSDRQLFVANKIICMPYL